MFHSRESHGPERSWIVQLEDSLETQLGLILTSKHGPLHQDLLGGLVHFDMVDIVFLLLIGILPELIAHNDVFCRS